MKSNEKILSIGFGFGFIDTVESFSIASLMFVLNRSFFHAVVDSTSVKVVKRGMQTLMCFLNCLLFGKHSIVNWISYKISCNLYCSW